jgi:hypothetical protein
MKNFVFGALGFSFLLAGCGSDSGSSAQGEPQKSGGPNGANRNSDGSSNGSGQDAGKKPLMSSFRWVSDNEGISIKPCKPGQLMANAECWDEVHFKPSGVTLTRPGASFVFFENGVFASDYLKSQYIYLNGFVSGGGSYGDVPRKKFRSLGHQSVFDWFYSFRNPWGVDHSALPEDPWEEVPFVENFYVFAPAEAEFSLPEEDRTLERAKIGKIEFGIVFKGYYAKEDGLLQTRSWRAKGTVETCGKILNLSTFTQGDVEKACSTGPAGVGARFDLPVPNGVMDFAFSPYSGNPTTSRPSSIFYDLHFPGTTPSPISTPTGGEVRP